MDALSFFEFAGTFAKADRADPVDRIAVVRAFGESHPASRATIEDGRCALASGHIAVCWAESTTVDVGPVRFVRASRDAPWPPSRWTA